MSKNKKNYHLAISYTRYPTAKKLPITKDTQTQKESHPLQITRTSISSQNIFNNNFEIRLRKLQMEEKRNYEVVGYKEIQDISLRLQRKKRLVESATKGTKLTYFSTNSTLKNSQDYLTKDEVVKYFSPLHLTTNTSRSKLESSPATPSKHKRTHNISRKDNQRPAHSPHSSEQFSLAKLRTKLEDYQSKWKKQIQNKRKIVKVPHKQAESKVISVIQSVDQYRVISEDRQKLTIEEKLNNMSPSAWQKILRSPDDVLQSTLKSVSHVAISGALKSVGQGKYKKELLWLQDKDRRGYFFKKDKTLAKHSLLA